MAIQTYSKYLQPYISKILNNEIEHCKEQEQMIHNIVLPVLAREDVYIDEKKIEDGLSLQKYFPYKLIEWEVFLFALIAGVHLDDGDIFFNDVRIFVGRGSGKNGFISFLCFYFLSPFHGINGYNIDLLANSETQAKTSFNDLFDIIKDPHDKSLKKALDSNYHATKEIITGKRTKSELRFNTSSKRGKDSKRTGCVIYDEKHEYLDGTNINTLRSGLGKVWHGREITITTDGHVRGAVLDKEKEENKDILKKYDPLNRTLVFWCRIEKEEEWQDINKLIKAIPSLNDFPALRSTIQKEITKMPYTQDYYPEFLAKRCNYPIGNKDLDITAWENVEVTIKHEIPDLEGMKCIGGLDYSKTNDFVTCGLLFKNDGYFIFLQHTFICASSRDLAKIKEKGVPIDEWVKDGQAEIVEDVEIPVELITGWFAEMQKRYYIHEIAIDNYRLSLLNSSFRKLGFEAFEKKNLRITRKGDLIKVAPVIDSAFTRHKIMYETKMMRWYAWNTKKVINNDGNMVYEKIDPALRKNDGFMAFAHAMTREAEIPDVIKMEIPDIGVFT